MEEIHLQPLFFLQKKLDRKIQRNVNEKPEIIILKKALALKVEIGELMNETRVMKYWSKKGPSEADVILEEYVDGLHFVISLANDKGFRNVKYKYVYHQPQHSMELLQVFDELLKFDWFLASLEMFEMAFELYLYLGFKLGFSWEQIKQAYVEKNMINHERQEKNY